jgi:ATP-dependent Clp protease, protease subunit
MKLKDRVAGLPRSPSGPFLGPDHMSEDLPSVVFAPQVRLLGGIEEGLFRSFREQVEAVAEGAGPIAIELMTSGGDADVGRRLALEVRLARERLKRRLVFVGKTSVYSAGVTVMAGFARDDRFLTHDAVLMIHERQLDKSLQLRGPMRASEQRVRQVLEEIQIGLELEKLGFQELIEGSDIALDEILEKAATSWYLTAEQALKRGLIAGVF